jgi:hypothetical protein
MKWSSIIMGFLLRQSHVEIDPSSFGFGFLFRLGRGILFCRTGWDGEMGRRII